MGRKKKDKFIDDGRVIANMNVDGMPWYSPQEDKASSGDNQPIELTPTEKRAMMSGVLGAALLVTVIFIGGFALLILFCIHVWFA